MNLNLWDIMAPAFFECLILVGIHSYLGIHVIKRKVIFVDLALAQTAALGTTIGFLFGILPGTAGAYWFSLGFAILGAAIFSLTRFRNEKIPQEAIIGLAYAIAAAVAILVIDKAPHGAEHIKELLTGSILWVKWETIGKAALVYSGVGVFHYVFRDKFLLISNDPEGAYQAGMNVRLWDFLFYVSFGVVITHSVGTAGVLLVFVFLVVPAIAAILITDVLWKQLLIGWGMGLFVSVFGLYISYIADLPSGPTVVAFYGFMLLLVGIVLYYHRTQEKQKAIFKISTGVLGVIVVFIIFYALGTWFGNAHHHTAQNEQHAHHRKVENNHLSPQTQTDSVALWLQSLHQSNDLLVGLEYVKKISRTNKKLAVVELLPLLNREEAPFMREEMLRLLEEMTGRRFGFQEEKNVETDKQANQRIQEWLSRRE